MERKKNTTGEVPGTVIFTGTRKVEHVDVHYVEYSPERLKDEHLSNQSIQKFHEPTDGFIQWYDVRGLHDTTLIEEFGKVFKMHTLVLEDIADVHQRPKFEEYEDACFLTVDALKYDRIKKEVVKESVVIYLGNGFVISFQENADDLFENVRKRIHSGRGRIRSRGADYLCYALVDTIVDYYFLMNDNVSMDIAVLEEEILTNPHEKLKRVIHSMKMELLQIRKSISPLREAINQFSKSGNNLIDDKTNAFFRDVYDHIIQMMDITETNRDLLSGLQDLYISELSFRMNKVMQLLTVITTIFIPLSFFTGLYGMNFDNIPELHYKYSYFILLFVMFVMAISLLWFFRKKKWI